MGRLLLVRHGHSEGNALGVFQGQTEYPLSEQGRVEATAVAKRLAREQSNVEALVSSPLRRAHHTAEAIVRSAGHLIQVVDGLKERDVVPQRNSPTPRFKTDFLTGGAMDCPGKNPSQTCPHEYAELPMNSSG